MCHVEQSIFNKMLSNRNNTTQSRMDAINSSVEFKNNYSRKDICNLNNSRHSNWLLILLSLMTYLSLLIINSIDTARIASNSLIKQRVESPLEYQSFEETPYLLRYQQQQQQQQPQLQNNSSVTLDNIKLNSFYDVDSLKNYDDDDTYFEPLELNQLVASEERDFKQLLSHEDDEQKLRALNYLLATNPDLFQEFSRQQRSSSTFAPAYDRDYTHFKESEEALSGQPWVANQQQQQQQQQQQALNQQLAYKKQIKTIKQPNDIIYKNQNVVYSQKKPWTNSYLNSNKNYQRQEQQQQHQFQQQAFVRQTKHGNQIIKFRVRRPLKSGLFEASSLTLDPSMASSSFRSLRSSLHRPISSNGLSKLPTNMEQPSQITNDDTIEQKSIRSSKYQDNKINNNDIVNKSPTLTQTDDSHHNNVSILILPDLILANSATDQPVQDQPEQSNTFNKSQHQQQQQISQIMTSDDSQLQLTSVTNLEKGNERDVTLIDQLLEQQQQHQTFTSTEMPTTKLGFALETEDSVLCRTRKYTYRAVKSDSKGNKCWDHITANVCYGRCDSGEIADWLFPHKKSIHYVCVHKDRIRQRTRLSHCTSAFVDPELRMYHYMDAVNCACQKCSSSNAVCRGGLVVDPPLH